MYGLESDSFDEDKGSLEIRLAGANDMAWILTTMVWTDCRNKAHCVTNWGNVQYYVLQLLTHLSYQSQH